MGVCLGDGIKLEREGRGVNEREEEKNKPVELAREGRGGKGRAGGLDCLIPECGPCGPSIRRCGNSAQSGQRVINRLTERRRRR